MYESDIIETVNGRANEELKQWYDTKVKSLALLLAEKLGSQSIRIERLKLEKVLQRLGLESEIENLPLEIPEEVLAK